jgi:uncharacterized protein YndB with AHSA1/START domain
MPPHEPEARRIDQASRVIAASPQAIYRAFLDPEAVAAWRPPSGMSARIAAFDPREGGGYRMSFIYMSNHHGVRGKTSDHADEFEGRFLELVPDLRIVELVAFDSDDPAFAGEMTVTTTLAKVPGGTEVKVRCENVPDGIAPGDHQAGISSSLDNLARLLE